MTDEGWISVEDRLPENNRDVLVWAATSRAVGNYDTAYQPDPWFVADENVNASDITHWHELPDPPKKRG